MTWRSRFTNCARSPTGKSPSTSSWAPPAPTTMWRWRSRPAPMWWCSPGFYYVVGLAVRAGADVVVLDGRQGGPAATQEVFIEHVGIPILAAIRPAVQALQDLGMRRKVPLI